MRCSDRSLYTGVTTDLNRRVVEHNTGKTAAAYTRSRRPVLLVYQQKCASRSAALKREIAIKKLDRAGKQKLVRNPSKA